MRKFERVKDFAIKYNATEVKLPVRSTAESAGYDFFAVADDEILPLEIKPIYTNVKVKLNKGEFLMLCNRSSYGIKNVALPNGVGIIDKDYYSNPGTDGNISFLLKNNNNVPFQIKKGDRIGQGIIMKYYTLSKEKRITNKRIGNFGSTGA